MACRKKILANVASLARAMVFLTILLSWKMAGAAVYSATETFNPDQGFSYNYPWVQAMPEIPSGAEVIAASVDLRALVWHWGTYPARIDLLCSDGIEFLINDPDYQLCRLTPQTHPSSSRFYTIACPLKPNQIDWLTDDGRLNLMVATSSMGTYYLETAVLTVETTETTPPIPGDIDGDRDVDLADLIIALGSLSGMQTAGQFRSDGAMAALDVDGDDRTGSAEAVYIMETLSGSRP